MDSNLLVSANSDAFGHQTADSVSRSVFLAPTDDEQHRLAPNGAEHPLTCPEGLSAAGVPKRLSAAGVPKGQSLGDTFGTLWDRLSVCHAHKLPLRLTDEQFIAIKVVELA